MKKNAFADLARSLLINPKLQYLMKLQMFLYQDISDPELEQTTSREHQETKSQNLEVKGHSILTLFRTPFLFRYIEDLFSPNGRKSVT